MAIYPLLAITRCVTYRGMLRYWLGYIANNHVEQDGGGFKSDISSRYFQ